MDANENVMQDKSGGFSVEEISKEKQLLKSVEGLISAIKSGQLVREQEQSSKRMQEILGSVLDKASLSLLDPSFKQKNESIFEEEEEEEESEERAEYRKSSSNIHKASSSLLINDTSNELKVPSRYSLRHSAKSLEEKDQGDASSKAETISQLAQENLMEESENDLYRTQNEGYYLETERDLATQQSSRSRNLASEYDQEMQAYLASLSEKVTYEDVLNTTATKVKLFERPKSATTEMAMARYHSSQKKRLDEDYAVPKQKTDERFARNLHYFCMLEHERRHVLLLPEELADVTRKFHTRNKYQFIQTHKSSHKAKHSDRLSVARTSEMSSDNNNTGSKKTPSSASALSGTDMETQSEWDTQKDRSHEAAAQRVFDNLNEIIQFERQKTHYYRNDDLETKSNADSGIGDNSSLDSWRLQAESALKEDFCLS